MSLSNDNYLGAEKTTLRHKTAMAKSDTQNPSLATGKVYPPTVVAPKYGVSRALVNIPTIILSGTHGV